VQRLERLLDRRRVIKAVDLVEVDVVHPEPRQAGVDLGEDRLARQPGAVGARPHAPIDLGGDDDLVAAGEIADRAAENLLAVAERIAVGGVEEIDAGVDRFPDKRPAFLLAEAPGVIAAVAATIAHATKADARDVEAGAAELGVFHHRAVLADHPAYFAAATRTGSVR